MLVLANKVDWLLETIMRFSLSTLTTVPVVAALATPNHTTSPGRNSLWNLVLTALPVAMPRTV